MKQNDIPAADNWKLKNRNGGTKTMLHRTYKICEMWRVAEYETKRSIYQPARCTISAE